MSEAIAADIPAGALIAGFWRRIFAFVVDALVLAVPAHFIALQFYDQLVALGDQGRLIGFPISFLYFSILNSRISGGQTIGKSLVGIRVVGASGQPIGYVRAALRALVLSIPFYLNGLNLAPFLSDNPQAQTLAGTAASLFVFGFGVSIFYLYIFNTKTRQSLHDLFVESFVVRGAEGAVAQRVWPVHVAVVVGLLALSLGGPVYVIDWAQSPQMKGTFSDLTALQDDLASDPLFAGVGVTTEWFTMTSSSQGTSSTTFLTVHVQLRKRVDDLEPIKLKIAAKVLKRYPKLMGQEQLKIIVGYGYDIGIASAYTSESEAETAEEWRKKLGPESPVV